LAAYSSALVMAGLDPAIQAATPPEKTAVAAIRRTFDR
jgi:hypothetical protein